MDGIPNLVKESVGEYTSTKYIWFKLEREYQKARPQPKKIDEESIDNPMEEIHQEEDKK